ncbi:unnamed protein product [Heligmosomoides polygyrus]|uniref:G_PROTEIN_RECEP_F1_2 domain-containing protein n=1 Tax=Heligmosomoides polygyrus TaxID=6339 RepID=A0A183FVN9_HELPZ|nr:unnamed protein product [Heligmosomoides polygyrus]
MRSFLQLFYHNGFDDCSNANDLAVFELEKDVKLSTAIPICMPKRNTTIPYLLMSIGSGISRPPEQDEDVLKIPSFGNQLMFNYFLKTSNKRIYTTLPPGKDYGYSISAFNEVWNPCERPDVFTASTDVRRYLDWICDKTGVCSTKVAEDDPDTDYCNNDKDIKSSASSFHLCIVLLYLLLGPNCRTCTHQGDGWIVFVFLLHMLVLSIFTFVGVWESLPDDAFRAEIYGENPNIEAKAFIGVSLGHSHKLPVFLAAYDLAVTLLVFLVVVFCSIRIQSALMQTSCPTVFLFIPSCVTQAVFIGRIDTNPLVTDCIGFLYSLYPLSNSLVTMFSIADYRRCLLSLVRRWKCTQIQPTPLAPGRILAV